MKNLSRPEKHLNTLAKRYPNMSENVNHFRQGKGKDLPDWPNFCFLPCAAWTAIATNGMNFTADTVKDISLLTSIGGWRYSQGIYEFNDKLMDALIKSPLFKNLPCEVLLRLPEWHVYIKTPGLKYFDDNLNGFFASIEFDVKTEQNELRLMLDLDNDLVSMPLHLGDWDLEKSLTLMAKEAEKHTNETLLGKHEIDILSDEIRPILSFLLYLCSDEPEIHRNDMSVNTIPKPSAKKTKKRI